LYQLAGHTGPHGYAGRLWVLESGTGGLGVVDVTSGRYEPLVALRAFTRGLDFCGPLAFVGLSQVRETAVFSGIPITEPAIAGDIRRSGAARDPLPGIAQRGKHELVADSFVLSDEALHEAPPEIVMCDHPAERSM